MLVQEAEAFWASADGPAGEKGGRGEEREQHKRK
jgi:hypothetical protein